MTDDLVERLRDLGIRSADLAADRIEALTARVEAAEADAARLLGALEHEVKRSRRHLSASTLAILNEMKGEQK